MSPVAATLEHGLSRLDGLRQRSFRLALRSRVLSACVVRRDRRLTFFASVHAAVAFVLSIYYPVLLFVLAPVLLGVAHAAADVRYLVLRQRLEGVWRGIVITACTALLLLAMFRQLRWVQWSEQMEFGFAAAWAVAGVVAASVRSRAWWRGAVGLVVALGVGSAALCWPVTFRLAYLHGHNLVALAAWPLFFRTRLRFLSWLRLPILAAAALLATGFWYRESLASAGARQFGVHVFQLSDWLAPSLRADWAVGLTSAFVFLQAVHYSIWLSVVPQAEMPGEGSLSFRRSARALQADFGSLGLVLLFACIAAVALFAMVNVRRASSTYMTLALFHGYLELVMLLYFWVAGERLGRRPAPRASSA